MAKVRGHNFCASVWETVTRNLLLSWFVQLDEVSCRAGGACVTRTESGLQPTASRELRP